MSIDNALASVAVRNIETASSWYARLLGQPGSKPMPEVAEWRFARGGCLQVYELPERAGQGSMTLAVSDIDAETRRLAALDIDTSQRSSSSRVKTLMFTDPDGNHIALAEARDPALAGAQIEHLRFPNESDVYRKARNALLDSEMALRRQIEQVSAQRRALPPGGKIAEDYLFESLGVGGQPYRVKLSQLFAPGRDSLALYSFMFGPERDRPCPGCTHFLDSLDGVARHASERLNLFVVAKSPLARLQGFARERGWSHLNFLSTAGNSYDADYFGDSHQLAPAMRRQQAFKPGEEWDMPMLNVFHRDADGVRHFWGSEMLYAPPEPGQEYRHNDLIDPLWQLLDTTPEGRGDFQPKLAYPVVR